MGQRFPLSRPEALQRGDAPQASLVAEDQHPGDGADVPSRVYTYVRGPERYTIQVADYSQAPRLLDELVKKRCMRRFTWPR